MFIFLFVSHWKFLWNSIKVLHFCFFIFWYFNIGVLLYTFIFHLPSFSVSIQFYTITKFVCSARFLTSLAVWFLAQANWTNACFLAFFLHISFQIRTFISFSHPTCDSWGKLVHVSLIYKFPHNVTGNDCSYLLLMKLYTSTEAIKIRSSGFIRMQVSY